MSQSNESNTQHSKPKGMGIIILILVLAFLVFAIYISYRQIDKRERVLSGLLHLKQKITEVLHLK